MRFQKEHSMRIGNEEVRHWIARRSAPLMFALALTFLVCQAVLVVVWVDVPNLSENAILAITPDTPQADALRLSLSREIIDHHVQDAAILIMLAIWPIVLLESIFHWVSRPWNAELRKFHFFALLFCICPSLRMCARCPELRYRLWLPGLGWRTANRRLRRRLQRHFSMPMILIALMIMPLLVIEFFMKSQVAEYEWLRLLLHIGTGVIWFAFAAEFILMASVAENKLAYCRRHWIDLAIIVLPLFSFLRSLRLVRATQVLGIPQLTKMARAYRLRGTAVKALRALVLLELVQRLTGSDLDRSINKLSRQLSAVEAEAKVIRRRIARLKRRQRQEQQTLSET